jgi:hypothetical protein
LRLEEDKCITVIAATPPTTSPYPSHQHAANSYSQIMKHLEHCTSCQSNKMDLENNAQLKYDEHDQKGKAAFNKRNMPTRSTNQLFNQSKMESTFVSTSKIISHGIYT